MKTILGSLLLIFTLIFLVSAVDAADDWTQKSPAGGVKPSVRDSHAMAYIGDNKVLLFGGYDGSNKGDTWVYNLSTNTWTDQNPQGDKPSARYYPAMAYIGGDKVLSFGGRSGSSQYNDTWVYDFSANTWTDQNPQGDKPSARNSHAMAYIGDDKVLLFGGYPNVNDTWVYDLSENTWTQDENTTQPSARHAHKVSETSMNGSSYLVLFGGYDGSYDDETWTFGGGDYSLPVELSTFAATTSGDNVILKWRTETEVNNLGFGIYRSEKKDGNYTWLAFVEGAGNSAMPNDYQFTDKKAEAGKTYFYHLEDVDIAGEKNRSKIIKVVVPPAKPARPIPKEFRLLQNFPNPFNPDTWLPYQLATDVSVSIQIYNIQGQLVRRLNLGEQEAGSYVTKDKAIHWDGRDERGDKVASGVYWYTLRAGEFNATRRMVILK